MVSSQNYHRLYVSRNKLNRWSSGSSWNYVPLHQTKNDKQLIYIPPADGTLERTPRPYITQNTQASHFSHSKNKDQNVIPGWTAQKNMKDKRGRRMFLDGIRHWRKAHSLSWLPKMINSQLFLTPPDRRRKVRRGSTTAQPHADGAVRLFSHSVLSLS